ncbi:MAG: FecR domain-containing protein [Gemmatimonadota bacterium]|nr:FecR domain-containing protein [Gemmatimonadota bacterium]
MDDLIIRVLQGRAVAGELRRLQRWRALDPANEDRFRALQRVWAITSFAETDVQEVPSPDPQALIERAEGRICVPGHDASATAREDEAGDQVRNVRRSAASGSLTGLRAGLVAAGVAALGFGLAVLADGMGFLPEPLAARTVATGPGEVVTVTLADGSDVRVGPESELTFTGTGRNRTVRLEGRAFFGVAEDDDRRFIVETEQGRVAVFGTRFEVRSKPERFRVTVVEGKVGVTSEELEVELVEGEMSDKEPGRPLSKRRASDIHDQLEWMGNHLVFRATPLARVVEEVRRHFGVAVTLDAPQFQDVPITATFTNRSADDVILVLCEIVKAGCQRDPSRSYFRIGTSESSG